MITWPWSKKPEPPKQPRLLKDVLSWHAKWTLTRLMKEHEISSTDPTLNKRRHQRALRDAVGQAR